MQGRATELEPNARPSALTGVRVVDMAGWSGQYSGKQFAELGAAVILVEPLEIGRAHV